MKWLDFLTGGAGSLVDSIGDAIDKNITSDEERGKLRNELVKLNQDFMVKAYEFEAKQAEVTAKDRETARNREVELAKLGKKNTTMGALVAFALIGMLGLSWFALTKDIRERDIFLMIIGVAIAKMNDIYGFYFGSSHSSSEKNETIKTLLNN